VTVQFAVAVKVPDWFVRPQPVMDVYIYLALPFEPWATGE
jgi:hypothetical protein